MNTIDIVLLCCFLPAIYTGIKHGFVRQLASLLALFLGAYCAYRFSSFLNIYLEKWFSLSGNVVDIISFTVIFIIVLLIVNLIGAGIKQIVSIALLGWLDKTLGIVFSILKSIIIISVLIYVLEAADKLWPFLPHGTIKGSVLYGPISETAPRLFPYLSSIFG